MIHLFTLRVINFTCTFRLARAIRHASNNLSKFTGPDPCSVWPLSTVTGLPNDVTHEFGQVKTHKPFVAGFHSRQPLYPYQEARCGVPESSLCSGTPERTFGVASVGRTATTSLSKSQRKFTTHELRTNLLLILSLFLSGAAVVSGSSPGLPWMSHRNFAR